jgi:hypothetical protein
MKVNNGAGSTNVAVKVHGATSQTTGSVEMNEETTTTNSWSVLLICGHKIKGTDARLVILED